MVHQGAASLATDVTDREWHLSRFPDGDGQDETCWSATRQAHSEAVMRILRLMREDFSSNLTLDDMAAVAHFSPYYANRLFLQMTGVRPRHFLAAIRFAEAKRLLADSSLNVTEICNEVGYASLGSFTSRFHQSVGISPRTFRRYARSKDARLLSDTLLDTGSYRTGAVIRGSTVLESHDKAMTFIGLFPTSIPQGMPLACGLAQTPGPFEFSCSRRGRAFLLAVAMPEPDSLTDCLLPAQSDLRVASQPLNVPDPESGPVLEVELQLRPLEPTDPPVVTALPYLLERILDRSCGSNRLPTDDGAASR